MPATRFVLQAADKIRAICAVMHRADGLGTNDIKALAAKADIPYSTLKDSIRRERFSVETETKLAAVAKFDPEHSSWIDDSIPEAQRRAKFHDQYRGKDTAEHFRKRLVTAWAGASVNFRVRPNFFKAIDAHMADHELTDVGQTTPAGSEMLLFFTARFEPFRHRSGMSFGFRQVTVTIDIECPNGARVATRLGHPEQATIGDAVLRDQSLSQRMRWKLEGTGPDTMLSGEYTTCDAPLLAMIDYEDGTRLTSRLQVNLYDGDSFMSGEPLDLSANKRALIQQIFANEPPAAESANGWITLSRQDVSVARFMQ